MARFGVTIFALVHYDLFLYLKEVVKFAPILSRRFFANLQVVFLIFQLLLSSLAFYLSSLAASSSPKILTLAQGYIKVVLERGSSAFVQVEPVPKLMYLSCNS